MIGKPKVAEREMGTDMGTAEIGKKIESAKIVFDNLQKRESDGLPIEGVKADELEHLRKELEGCLSSVLEDVKNKSWLITSLCNEFITDPKVKL